MNPNICVSASELQSPSDTKEQEGLSDVAPMSPTENGSPGEGTLLSQMGTEVIKTGLSSC